LAFHDFEMTTLRQCIETLGLDRRTCNFCMKCDLGYQERFDNAIPAVRQTFVEALAAVSEDDFTKPLPVLGLIALLNESEFEDFIAQLARRAPFDPALAWEIIRHSSHGVGSWFFQRGNATYQRCFYLHPTIAPLLIKAAIRPDKESEDIIALFDCYGSVAEEYTILRNALPQWHKELKRRERERIAREEMAEVERLRQEAEQAVWMRKINAITSEGPAAILQSLAEALTLEGWRFPSIWGNISDVELRAQPSGLLLQALGSISHHANIRCCRRLAHKVQSAIQTQKRAKEIDQLAALPLIDRLKATCQSRWSLTYYPADWAEELLADTTGLSDEMRANLLPKLMRIQRRGSWGALRQNLIR